MIYIDNDLQANKIDIKLTSVAKYVLFATELSTLKTKYASLLPF